MDCLQYRAAKVTVSDPCCEVIGLGTRLGRISSLLRPSKLHVYSCQRSMAYSTKKLKRPRYCPELAQSFAKKRREVSLLKVELEETVEKARRMRSLLSSDDVLSAELSNAAVELLLVTALGLTEVLRIQQALSAVPKNLPDRVAHVLCLAREEITGMNADQCSRCVQLIERLEIMRESSDTNQGSSSVAAVARNHTRHRRFLSPPVFTCINTDCRIRGSNGSLTKNHDPITVTVYTLSGPEVALKHTLKCRACSFIYNYSTYGRKSDEGERYYDSCRDLIEVSDTTYCERQLYEFFCSLRYINYACNATLMYVFVTCYSSKLSFVLTVYQPILLKNQKSLFKQLMAITGLWELITHAVVSFLG